MTNIYIAPSPKEIKGKCGISAKVIADSISNHGIRLTTLELKYPRFIHSQLLTHRMFSRNSSSSRAIPTKKLIEQVIQEPAKPIKWGKDQKGMQSYETNNELVRLHGIYPITRLTAWKGARDCVLAYVEAFDKAGYHKQIVNRLLEPFLFIKTLVTATEWDNFFKLRLGDAQPEIQELAKCMYYLLEQNCPTMLNPGDWHTPFVSMEEESDVNIRKQLSVARNARISYQNHDKSTPSKEKDMELCARLYKDGHMSPFEHIATPMEYNHLIDIAFLETTSIEKGVTHISTSGDFWSGNFKGWIQFRQTNDNT